MIKAGSKYAWGKGVFEVLYDSPEIRGTLAEGYWYDFQGFGTPKSIPVTYLRSENKIEQDNKNTLELKVKVATSELDAALEKVKEFNKETSLGTDPVPALKAKKLWTKYDLFVGMCYQWVAGSEQNWKIVKIENTKVYATSYTNGVPDNYYFSEMEVNVPELIENLTKLQPKIWGTRPKKVYTKNDLYIGMTFSYLAPYNKNGYYYKITGFKGDKVVLDEYDKNNNLKIKDASMSVIDALERINQE
jgi:hypothetical protein